LGKKARKVEIKLLAEPATEPNADQRYRFGIRYRIRNSEDQAIEEFSLTHDLNRVFKKGGFEFESVRLVADPSCTQEAVQAKTPDEVPESEAPAEELAALPDDTTCSGGPLEKGSILLAITGERPDDAGTVQRYFSDHITAGDPLMIEQITSDKPWNPLRLKRAFQVFEGRHRLSEAPRRTSLVLLKIPMPSDGREENAVPGVPGPRGRCAGWHAMPWRPQRKKGSCSRSIVLRPTMMTAGSMVWKAPSCAAA
jgi:hypothetical protein